MSLQRGRTTRERLGDITSAVDAIEHTQPRLEAAEAAGDATMSRICFDAIMFRLVVIGEAVNHLPESMRSAESEVPWRDIVDMRNFLSHVYFRVLADVVHATLDEPLAQLRAACERLMTYEPPTPGTS